MSKTQAQQTLINWLDKEKNKDRLEVERTKEKFIKEIKGIKKEDLFKKQEQPKLTLWKKIKLILLGS